MVFILDVDDAPTVLASADLAAIDHNAVFATDHGEWNKVIDVRIELAFLIVLLIVVVWVHAKIVEGEFFLDALFESEAFFKGEGVGFGDHGDDVDDIGEFLEDYDVDRFETVSV